MSRRIIVGGRDMTEHVQRTVAAAPPLSAQQIAQLRGLLAPAVGADITTVTPRKATRPRAQKAA